jgi:hypothetical protein
MKSTINLILVGVILSAGLIVYSGGCGGLASQKDLLEVKKELLEHRQEFKAEMDSLHWELDTVSKNVKYIKYDTDSIKKGQQVIYNISKKVSERKSFIDKLNELIK